MSNVESKGVRYYHRIFKMILFKTVLRCAYEAEDELLTRTNIVFILTESIKDFPGDEALQDVYEELSDKFDEMSWLEMQVAMDGFDNSEMLLTSEPITQLLEEREKYIQVADKLPSEEEMTMEVGLPLFRQIKAMKKGEKMTLYVEGQDSIELMFQRHFTFEKDVYVVFGDKKGEFFFKYVAQGENDEKLLPVNDSNLLRLFDYLKL